MLVGLRRKRLVAALAKLPVPDAIPVFVPVAVAYWIE
jgi:hypothetical protein